MKSFFELLFWEFKNNDITKLIFQRGQCLRGSNGMPKSVVQKGSSTPGSRDACIL